MLGRQDDGPRPLVLLADDEEAITANLAPFLERSGFRVHVVHDGEAALRAVHDRDPDLCVLDVLMPKLNGREVLRRLRADGVEVVVNTVGFALGDNQTARDQLTCIAEATDGQFTDVAEAGDLAATLEDVSARETRRIETHGQELTGAAIPRDAETGELDTQYVDTVVHGEVNFYRFEVEPGSRVEAEVYTAGNPNSDDLHCMGAYLVDKTDANYAYSDLGGDSSTEDQIDVVEPTVVDDADEVYLKLESSDCRGSSGNPNIQFDVELLVRVVD
jgi:CheY-like chemotaxis protein